MFKRHGPGGCCCSYEGDPACSYCRLGTVRDYVDVLFPVITDGDESCCSELSESTYRLDDQTFDVIGCQWSEDYTPAVGNCWLKRITVMTSPSRIIVTLQLEHGADKEWHRWRTGVLSSPIDCDWDEYEVPWYDHNYDDMCTVATDTIATLTSGDYP